MSRRQVIVVMGVTGVGKSTFIQYATGHAVKIGHGHDACTDEVSLYQIPGTDVYLMDTPGFDDPAFSDAKILTSIATSLVAIFNAQVDIQGALYIHPVTEVRLRGSGRKNLIMFRNMLGTRGMSNCRLVTTKWSLQSKEVSETREKELREKEGLWKPLVAAGAQTVRFGDSSQSAIEIIKPLIEGPAFEPLILEEITKGKTLPQTQAGQVVNDDVEEAYKTHQAEIANLKAEEEKARIQKDAEYAEILRAEREDHQAKMNQLEKDKELLAKPISTSEGFFYWLAAVVIDAVVGGLMGRSVRYNYS
jgi:GTPase SAR1 family protein